MNERTGDVFKEGARWYGRVSWTETRPDGSKARRFRRRAAKPRNRRSDAMETARKLVDELERELSNAGPVPLSLHALLDYYESKYVHAPEYHHGKRQSGYASWRSTRSLIKTLKRIIPNKSLARFTAEDCRQAKLAILRDPVRQGTKWEKRKAKARSIANVDRLLAILRRVLKKGEELRFLDRNPFPKDIIKPSHEVQRTRILSGSEEALLLASCAGERIHLRPIIIALIDTGMRVGELQKRTRADFDFDAQEIAVYATKTEEPRIVPMSDRLKAIMLEWGDDELRDDFRPFDIGIRRAWHTLKKVSGISDLRLHDLRHTFATRQIGGGMELAELARILGHKDIRTTYRYVNPHAGTVAKAKAIVNAANESRADLSVN